jgi:hypothetical protein
MEKFANAPPELRNEVFQEAAAQLGMSKAIIAKDFWVRRNPRFCSAFRNIAKLGKNG